MFKIKGLCEYCSKKLDLSTENHYVVMEVKKDGIFSNTTYYDAVDCKACGRQNIMGKRFIENNHSKEGV